MNSQADGKAFFAALLDVIETGGPDIHAAMSGTWSDRTQAFNGRVHRRADGRKFAKYESNQGLPLCVLTKLYERLYPDVKMTHGDQAPFFEWGGYDCIFPEHARRFDERFPIEWTHAFVIEVENDFDELAFTCRCLLDFVAKARVGIFFQRDPRKVDLAAISDKFTTAWAPFCESYGDVQPMGLWVVFLPDKFADGEQFRRGAVLARWDGDGGRFVAVS